MIIAIGLSVFGLIFVGWPLFWLTYNKITDQQHMEATFFAFLPHMLVVMKCLDFYRFVTGKPR